MGDDRRATPALTAPPPARHIAVMAVGVLAVGTSGPLIAAMTVPPLAIAFWRNLLGAAAAAPLVVFRAGRRAEVAGLGRGWRSSC